jgi:hypothetical protein
VVRLPAGAQLVREARIARWLTWRRSRAVPLASRLWRTERADAEAAAAAELERERANNPEGRREAARAAAEAAEARRRDVADARVLLVSEGRYSEDQVADFTNVEVLHQAGIEVRADLMSRREKDEAAIELASSGKWRTMSDMEKWQASRDLSDGGAGFLAAMDEAAGIAPATESAGESSDSGEGGAE